MTYFALLVLFSAAITLVWTEGSIFERLRTRGPELWQELAQCPLCSGVWIGGAAAAWLRPELGFPQVFQVLGTGCVTGCLALLFGLVSDFLGYHAKLAAGREQREKKVEGSCGVVDS